MNVTVVHVYSDASQKELGGSWGAVIVRPGAEVAEDSGKLRGMIPTSIHAEIKAAANAIHAALARDLIRKGDRVVVRCDNRHAVAVIANAPPGAKRKRSTKLRAELDVVAQWIFRTAEERGFTVTAKWVRGHVAPGKANGHELHNRRADLLCGIANGTRKSPEQIATDCQRMAARSKAAKAAKPATIGVHKARAARAVEIARRLEGVDL